MSSHTERQKKYLAKLKGCIGKDEYKEKELRRCKLKRQENLDSIQEKDRERQKWYQEQKKKPLKQILHLQHKKNNQYPDQSHT